MQYMFIWSKFAGMIDHIHDSMTSFGSFIRTKMAISTTSTNAHPFPTAGLGWFGYFAEKQLEIHTNIIQQQLNIVNKEKNNGLAH